MSKLLWIALPLLVLAALAAWRVRRRPLAWRHALNVWSSLLLLAYLATTAALGIFWVANQQLPVFDWHYLFGYMTLALLALHLSLNFGVVWRFLTRGSSTVSARGSTGSTRRLALGAFGALGALAALGVAFGLGQRQARREPGAAALAALGMPQRALAGLASVERYHALSGHSRAGLLSRAPTLDWGAAPASFKHYPRAERIALAPPGTALGRPMDLAALSATLWHTAGVTATRAGLRLRASPSSGALFATELYVVANSVAGLAPALWHYDARAHALERLTPGPPDDMALGAGTASVLQGAVATIVATAVFARTGHKYGVRSYRYVLADLGHALENLRQAALAVGASVHFVAAFDEARIAATLGLDEREEGVLALVALRPPGQPAPVASAGDLPAVLWHVPSVEASASNPLDAVHAATSLRAGVPAPPRAIGLAAQAAAPAAAWIALAPVAANAVDVLAVIRARRSVRRFASTALPLDSLAGVLAGMAAQGEPLLSAAVRVYVVANAVSGLPSGAYRYDAARHVLTPLRGPADLRGAAQAAAFDQEVIGAAAVVFVLSLDRAAFAADPAGPARGYRHAFLEAGLVGERVYLEAGARGLGACAVGAFHDDEAAALLAIDPAREWVVHFAALGTLAH
ncbi:SagB/ThcOx family dehydrogenase [Rhodoferax sp.]|uniref:SagB/ThcOx family dehydrogenase n=1 Tax=Rhodoferax sp. TaxID=50421 RepID=UPI00274BF7CA|nr:SagB/ThcOx family dehydrogenase [Rhodoferax sp.]